MASVYGYLRVSTDKQDTDRQRLELLEYAQTKRIPRIEMFSVQSSATSGYEKRRLLELFETVSKGDTVVVSELSRLARSVGQLIDIIDTLVEKGVGVISLKERIEVSGAKQDIATKTIVTIFALLAEIERDLLSQRTKDGLRAAKERGVILGRPKGSTGPCLLDEHKDEVIHLLGHRVPKAAIARVFGVSRNTVVRFCERNAL
jgi:DNA invertase Pin-like site-specific DNA recombinase